ncbi:MAG: hypothetical protein FJW86_06820 [Actinobacteria bacterium]|nr:hypothetical protein [Actinomycetota bacterium]
MTQQQRAFAIFGGVFGGGLLFTFLLVSLLSGGDDNDKKIAVGPNQPSTTSSTLTPTTLPPTTLPPTTLPPPPGTIGTSPPATVTPGTVVVVPTTSPPGPTTTTTAPPTVAEQLETILEETLLFGGEPPPPDTPPRVRVTYNEDDFIRVTWDLDATLTEEEQKYQAREEAAAILAAIKAFDGDNDERVVLRANLPDPDDPGETIRVVRLVYERASLDAIDFSTFDPLTVFDVPPADDADIDGSLKPAPPPTTSTSSSTTTTTT